LLCLLLNAYLLHAQQKYEKTVPATGVKKGIVRLEIPAGTLKMNATATQLLQAQVQYEHANWKPSLNLNKNNGNVEVKLIQENINDIDDNDRNEWVVNLSKNTPLALYLQMGAGESKIDLSNSKVQQLELEAGAVELDVKLSKSDLRKADIKAGVGELTLDLTGDWDHDLIVDVAGGIGEINLKLPKNTGVRLETAGLGSQNLGNLTKEGNYYRNAALGKSKHTLTIKATGGLGSITVMNEK
ncbi:MAG: cell wall-active antibiotics response protein, partial [Hymenobacteraceae bacterium]|nr:cell wall-active antibiotics response protein [Hymenobacteraceae bacterium]MDX5437404.1 cell wall-active antibiotics response protein [Pontibacter sp.]